MTDYQSESIRNHEDQLPPLSGNTDQEGGIWFLQSLVWFMQISWRGVCWSARELRYWFRLFLYSSRRFLRVELLLAIIGAALFFGVVVSQGLIRNQREMLEQCYLFFSAVMILFAMNLIPKEREEETLEILWSQPMNRNKMVLLHLGTLTTWTLLLCLVVITAFSHFMAYNEHYFIPMTILIVTTTFTVGAITILVSTFCRQAIATGLVTLLIMGIHYFWLHKLGPVEIFYNPIPLPEEVFRQTLHTAGRSMIHKETPSIPYIGNRIFVLIFVGFVLDYLFRRLKRTAEWFT